MSGVICPRCGGHSYGMIGSFFDSTTVCFHCRDLEETHPDFPAARDAENRAVEYGNYNFAGVGLPKHYAEWARVQPPTKGEKEAAIRQLEPYRNGYPEPMIDARRLAIANGTASLRDVREVKAEDVVIAGWRASGMLPR